MMKNHKSSDRVLLVCNRMSWCDIAKSFTETMFEDVESIFWNIGEPYPSRIESWEGEWILSFRGDLILSSDILKKASKGAINFHPAPPSYRGIGSHNYAIYNDDKEFGVTCHHIDDNIDSGAIIEVDRFPIAPQETASSLGLRAGTYCLVQYYKILTEYLISNKELLFSNEKWGENLYTYKKLDSWMQDVATINKDHPALR